MNVLALDKRDHQQMFNGQHCQLRKYIWSLDWLVEWYIICFIQTKYDLNLYDYKSHTNY